jgi:cytosine/adenosine deaminase-related metal-dependent hydrolase
MSAPATLVAGRFVVRGVSAEGAPSIVDDGAVLIRDGVIERVGPAAELQALQPDATVYGGSRYVVLPGFVNAHHHVGLTPLQLGSMDAPLELWLASRMAERDVDPRLDTLYSAFEMIETGVTTVQHLRTAPFGSSVASTLEGSRAIIGAYQDLGMRVSYSYWTRDQNLLAHEGDVNLAARLPAASGAQLRALLATSEISAEQSFEVFERLRRAYADQPLVAVQLAPANLHWCSDTVLMELRELSRRSGAPLHMHLVETAYQREYAHNRAHASAVEHLAELGLLGPLLTLGHAVWVSDSDIELLGRTGTRVCHNCSSNLRLRSGIAPLMAMLDHGVDVGLGMDEAGINDDRDMLQELRMVLTVHRRPGLDAAQVPNAAQVLRLATEGGAGTTGFADQVGRLEPGLAADLVVLDWEQLAGPYLDDAVPVVEALVRRGKARHVQTVLVGGRVVYDSGRFLLDRDAATAALAEGMARAPTADEQHRRVLAEVVARQLPAVYQSYLGPAGLTPFYSSNARE